MFVLLRFTVIFLAISTIFSMIRSLLTSGRQRPPVQQPQSPQVSTHLVKDPVCGTYVPEHTAVRGRDAFFCSEECRRKYAAG